ncbi:MAG: cob(I)yrinic acid a,c-diamide adenosyltransferase [Ectothiorhodospiraceae bacterium]|jgi:cob(I)alamin adenosyltransferase
MVKLTKIYTRTGDKGETALVNGSRVPKHHLRVTAYGTVDETNAAIGLARVGLTGELDQWLSRIQNDLFDLGADLATPEEEAPAFEPLRVVDSQVEWLEQVIDEMNAGLETLRSFILPGGTALAAHLHYARTVARRAERDITALAEHEPVSAAAISYMNRLSDFLFVAARRANRDEGTSDVLWQPGANR